VASLSSSLPIFSSQASEHARLSALKALKSKVKNLTAKIKISAL